MSTAVETGIGASSPPSKPSRRVKQSWLIWAAGLAFMLFQFCLQFTSGEMVDGFMHSFSLTALGGGVLASAYYYIYVMLQTPAGLLVDRFGPRRLLSMGAVVCALGCLLFGGTHLLSIAIVGRLLMGGGAAFAFVGLMYLVNKWFASEHFAMMIALSETIAMLVSLFAGVGAAALIQRMGWRVCILGAGVLGVFLALSLWSIVRDAPVSEAAQKADILPKSTLKDDLKILIGNRVIWVNAIYSGLLFAPVTVFAALWGVPYMVLAHHASLVQATFVCDMLFLGVAIGGPILSWFDGRGANRRRVLRYCSLASALLLALLIYFPSLPNTVLVIFMVLLGVASSSYLLNLVIGKEIVPSHLCGTSIGFVNTFAVGTAPLLQPLVGFLLTVAAGHHIAGGVAHYTVGDYQWALSVMVVVALGGVVLAPFIPVRTLDSAA